MGGNVPEHMKLRLFMAVLRPDLREAIILGRPQSLREVETLASLKEACATPPHSTHPSSTQLASHNILSQLFNNKNKERRNIDIETLKRQLDRQSKLLERQSHQTVQLQKHKSDHSSNYINCENVR